ncbi:hypothetical protein, conserved [Entamoeba dispar SAW760]|uniref:Uncharacterized protein n=1 Tax=Entamoeba dispar (strain ATCC PRA-260 / SAW760) TaxID=370354 RepID=B0E8F1_ENTDS|nr:uncharacterized protein EDI_033010 [Entamoeba dispar SAW760]EDR29194.1 hypothetical protein, conserved [Entamoeba dispar SAW760]|eukprot:EDR29194.1 hypothetical protein, conserved [Entamoeba dispar SAW760]
MNPHHEEWYCPGKVIIVKDKMQECQYKLSEPYGKNFDNEFKPYYSPKQMLKMGVFEGKYLNDCVNEFPIEWYDESKDKRSLVADPKLNYFGVKSRQSLTTWKKNGWIPVCKGDYDIRGWFQWYCRYYIGRRGPSDQIQIKRWKAFKRHRGQIDASIKKLPINKKPKTIKELKNHRPKQRQALLQWSHFCL